MLAQPLCGYRCVIFTCAAPMCCHGVCVQGLHNTGHLQHPTQELAIRVTTLTFPRTRMDWGSYNQATRITRDLNYPFLPSQP